MFEAYNPDTGNLQLPQLAFWQSTAKHLEGHYRFMKMDRARFDRWHPAAQQAFVEHMKETATAVDEIAENLVSASGAGLPGGPDMPQAAGPEGAPPGGGPGGGQPGPPQLAVMRGGAPAAVATDRNPNNQPALSRADMASASAH